MSVRTLPLELIADLDNEVRGLHARVSGVIGCVLATTDGRQVSAVVDNEADPQRVSAMVGSIVALGETIGREVMIGDKTPRRPTPPTADPSATARPPRARPPPN